MITRPSALWVSLFHLGHVVRGLIGVAILNSAPTVQDLIESTPLEDKVMHMAEISAAFTNHMRAKGLEYMDNNRAKLSGYGVWTGICLLVDIGLLLFTVWGLAVADMVL